MSDHDSSEGDVSLHRRRVLYQTGIADWSEGVVTHHDLESGVVIVLDEDGSFWRGGEWLVEVIV